MTGVIYRVDDENNAEIWWDAFRLAVSAMDPQSELYSLCKQLERAGEVELTADNAQAFDEFVTGLPGWEDGPAHARTALLSSAI